MEFQEPSAGSSSLKVGSGIFVEVKKDAPLHVLHVPRFDDRLGTVAAAVVRNSGMGPVICRPSQLVVSIIVYWKQKEKGKVSETPGKGRRHRKPFTCNK
ncbi:hypothetical protein V6N12_020774 [Hibiscus sabdariffa]|uniref:Uncharacterized protein n=1 Tax=Hibiscus sabdariffa TaxID=183260 RepID=A0ABR2CZ33_9ROSI